jgi:hypothetical protein
MSGEPACAWCGTGTSCGVLCEACGDALRRSVEADRGGDHEVALTAWCEWEERYQG